MTELSLQTARVCASNIRWIKDVYGKRGIYTVTYGEFIKGPYQYNYSCTCPSYRYGASGTCKHIALAERERCDYGHEAFAGSPIEMGEVCPECGEDTQVVRIGV